MGRRIVDLSIAIEPDLPSDPPMMIPQVGYIDNEGDVLENKHLAPDHLIDNDPALEAIGEDQQLEKAVEVLLGQLDG